MPDSKGELIFFGSYEMLMMQMVNAKTTQKIVEWYTGDDVPEIVQPSVNIKRNDKAWVHLMFLENRPRVNSRTDTTPTADKSRKKKGQISFRLMDVESPTRDNEFVIQRDRFIPLAERIRSKFANPPFIWHKGKELYSYCDHYKGLQLQLLVTDQSEAQRIVSQTMDLIPASPQWKYLNNPRVVNPGSRYSSAKDSITILGEKVNFPEERPIVDVTFRYAALYFPTVDKTFTLYDLTGRLRNPILARH